MEHGFDTTRFAALLDGLGKSFGLPGLAPDARGSCLLMFDDTVVTLQQDVRGHQLTVHAEVGHLAPDVSRQRVEDLLAANTFWTQTAGATLSLVPTTRALLLARRFELDKLTLAEFESALGDLLNAAELWRELIARPEEAARSSWDTAAAMAGVRA